MRRAALLAGAAAAYLLAAWMVAPGFYDGFTPQSPYNWVSPPPEAPPGNIQPSSGHAVIKVSNGVSEAASAFTDDGQLVVGFLQGAFNAAGQSTITVDIKPQATFPNPDGLHFATNVYLISASATLNQHANLVLAYSDIVPAPSDVYHAAASGGAWKSIGAAQQSRPFTIDTSMSDFGYFAAGYPSNFTPPPGTVTVGGGQLLPIAVAVLIVGVVVAGIPLAMVRRRRAAAGVEDEDAEDEDDEDEPER